MNRLRYFIALWASKSVYVILKLLKRNATMFPGHIALKICPDYLAQTKKCPNVLCITGTNGKTTTSHLIKDVLEDANIPCGVIGTLGIYYCDKFYEPTLTTPDPLDLHKILSDMYESGVKCAVMEVSAHAIFLDKVKNLKFHTAVFTNFSQDHLDFFINIIALSTHYVKGKILKNMLLTVLG